jgi:preprotein translocase subunit YajC
MWISPAYAQAAGGGGESIIPSLAMMALIFVVFYFLLIRPQQKKVKAHKEMLGALKRGDRVVTAGGIIGTVAKIPGDSEVTIEIAEGVRVKVMRGTISEVLAKAEPRDEEEGAKEPAEKK